VVLRLALTVALAATVLAGPQAAASEAKPVTAAYASVVIGESVRGRPIVAWHLGETKKPKVVLIAGMHGNEPAPTAILRTLRDGKSVHGVDLWVVPAYNPDGLARRSAETPTASTSTATTPSAGPISTGTTSPARAPPPSRRRRR
jgi:protein MpaA